MTDEGDLRLHEDPDLFREAVTFTVAESGFAARLIEKDYFCTVLLRYLLSRNSSGPVSRPGISRAPWRNPPGRRS
jgi:hypothetical protein